MRVAKAGGMPATKKAAPAKAKPAAGKASSKKKRR